MEFKKRNLEMARRVLKNLIKRCLIVSEDDALRKIQDAEFLALHGYGHVAHVLRDLIDVQECRSAFAEHNGLFGPKQEPVAL